MQKAKKNDGFKNKIGGLVLPCMDAYYKPIGI